MSVDPKLFSGSTVRTVPTAFWNFPNLHAGDMKPLNSAWWTVALDHLSKRWFATNAPCMSIWKEQKSMQLILQIDNEGQFGQKGKQNKKQLPKSFRCERNKWLFFGFGCSGAHVWRRRRIFWGSFFSVSKLTLAIFNALLSNRVTNWHNNWDTIKLWILESF